MEEKLFLGESKALKPREVFSIAKECSVLEKLHNLCRTRISI